MGEMTESILSLASDNQRYCMTVWCPTSHTPYDKPLELLQTAEELKEIFLKSNYTLTTLSFASVFSQQVSGKEMN